MKNALTLITLLIYLGTSPVVCSQTSINSAGVGAARESNGSITFSVGQLFNESSEVGTFSIWPGVQQPGEINNPLPVTLIYFKAISTPENQVQLSWSVASEFNNEFFTIERSGDAKKFSILKKKESNGDKNQVYTYYELDPQPLKGISYYRLKQTDLDGSYTYSRMVSVFVKVEDNQVITYPNPASEQLIIKLTNEPADNTIYELYHQNGKLVKTGLITNKSTVLEIDNLTVGIYLLKIKDIHNQAKTFKVVKM